MTGSASSRSAGARALWDPSVQVARRAPGPPESAQRALADFGADLLRRVGGAAANTAISPYSLVVVLAMARAGALGATGEQLDRALGLTGTPAQGGAITAVDDAVARAVQLTRGWPQPMVVQAANQVWLQQGLGVREDYLATLAEQFGVDVVVAAFDADPQGMRSAINGWVADRTHDLIPELFGAGSIDEATMLVLVNALYLKAAWCAPFTPGTSAERFTTADGRTVQVPLMRASELVGGVVGDGWVAAQLPYVGPGLAMTVLVPDEGMFAAVLDGLDAELMERAAAVVPGGGRWTLRMPRFRIDNVPDVQTAVQQLGVIDLFDPATVDLSGIAGAKGDLVATLLVHKAVVVVDENGTEAAAATGLGLRATGMPEVAGDIVVDRPFIFWIGDTTTGAPLFLGTVTEPGT